MAEGEIKGTSPPGSSGPEDEAPGNGVESAQAADTKSPPLSPLRPEPPPDMIPSPTDAPKLPPKTSPRRDDADLLIEPDGEPDEETPSRTELERAQEALERLRQKMSRVAAEFAAGHLNRAQFHAIYKRYNEQRIIAERLLERDPNSPAWRQVVQEGHTGFLRQHYRARVLSYTIYDNETLTPIAIHGKVKIDPKALTPIIESFRASATHQKNLPLKDGKWLILIAGHFTTAVILFSLEPSRRQLQMVSDLHLDFERANHHALERGIHTHERLVFPQRALFEESGSEAGS